MKKVISTVTLVIGTIIGAGFASGREIVTYFGEEPPLTIGLVGASIVFVMTLVFLLVGKLANATDVTTVNSHVLGNVGGGIVSVILLLNCAVSFSAMIAGVRALFGATKIARNLLPIIIGGLSILTVTIGIKGLKRVNVFLVPLLIVVIVSVSLCVKGELRASAMDLSVVSSAFVYISMNMLLASGVLITVSDLNKKRIVLTSIFTAIVVGALLTVIAYALSSSKVGQADMPLSLL